MHHASRIGALTALLFIGNTSVARANMLPSFPEPLAVETAPMLLVSGLLAAILARVSYVQLRKMAGSRIQDSHEGPE